MKKYKVNVNGTVYEVAIEVMDGAAPAAPAPAAPAAKKESDLPPMPAWQGHVYYANVPATAANGMTSRPIQPFAASYQPPHLVMGVRDDCTGTFTVTIDGKPYQVAVERADGPAPAAAPATVPALQPR